MTDAPALAPRDFAAFYEALHDGHDPPHMWLKRAAAELCEGKIWNALAAPTGAGKTTLIECFLFALAYTAQQQRCRLPRRLFWVIDRRSVADQVHLHASRIANSINNGDSDVLRAVRERLTALAMDANANADLGGNAVQVRLWRGGLAGEAAAADHVPLSPSAPAVICTTVDQIGSRLLFRGYGISRGSRPVEAALTAMDSLLVLDEAHLSGPFLQTANAIRQAQEACVGQPIEPLHVLPISATLEDLPADGFRLTAQERAEKQLAQRLKASKTVELKTGKEQVRRCVTEARGLASEGFAVIAVIVNTVATARSVARSLSGDGDVVLLIGPIRPLDRLGLLDRIPSREERAELKRKVFVLATQTIEVGVDLDFDALVTACAPYPSLVQRFGRLNRAGKMKGGARGVIVEPPKHCPVYGELTKTTWEWLCHIAVDGKIDFGPDEIELRAAINTPPAPDLSQAPILGPWHVDLLMQTSHEPQPDPEVAVFLHGERALDAADVQLCWRADLNWEGEDWLERCRARIQARPPHPGELLSLAPAAASRWLRQIGGAADLSDLESPTAPALPDDADSSDQPALSALRVLPPGPGGILQVEPLTKGSVRPGDVIVVFSHYGGCDEFGWAPESRAAVPDLGNLALRRPHILLSTSRSPKIPAELRVPEDMHSAFESVLARLDSEDLTEGEAFDELLPEISSWLKSGGGFKAKSSLADRAGELGKQLEKSDPLLAVRDGRVIRIDSSDGSEDSFDLLLTPPTPMARSSSAQAVSYEEHCEQVAVRTHLFAHRIGLSEELIDTVTLAACNHDAGKLDPRFQAWLNGGSPPGAGLQLAKSGNRPGEKRSQEARKAARWPLGKRHEATSATLVAAVAESAWPKGVDRDLLIHLVAAHHGNGRPFRNAAADPEPVVFDAVIATARANGSGASVRIRSDEEIPWSEHAERFVALNKRFGPWGLALLEAILVLADRAVSAEEGE
jgi:CRISPR-associated endonuclease/helicase Cas3